MVERNSASGVRAEERFVIRIERVALPAGLRAIAHRDPNGDVVIYVSDGLDAKRQRAAVLAALRASRRTGWRAWLLPIGLVLLPPLRRWTRHAAAAVRTHPAGWAAATTVVVAGAAVSGVFLGTAPHRHDSASARPPAPSVNLPFQPRQQHAPVARPGLPQPPARYLPGRRVRPPRQRGPARRPPRPASRRQRLLRRHPPPARPDRRPRRHRRRRRRRRRRQRRHRRGTTRSRASSS